MANIKLESKKTKTGKDSIVKDDNGYYKVTLGALNTYNANGIYYRVDDINRLTGPKSIIGSRIANGIVKSEVGHPDFTGLSGQALLNKILTIDLNNVCGHIKGIEFINQGRSEKGWEGYPIYVVQGWVKPSGPKSDVLKDALENEDENAPFSVRSVVIEKRIGPTLVRNVLEISTWDFVHEQGVSISSQWNAAGIEQSEHTMDDSGSLCLDGSCIPKLEKLISSGIENNDDAVSILESLKKEESKSSWVNKW